MPLRPLARWKTAFLLCCLLVAFAAEAGAATSQFQVLLNLDLNVATGCDATTVDGVFPGVEQILTTTVQTTGLTGAVTSITRQVCVTPATDTFGPPIAVPLDPGEGAIGVGNGTGGSDVIETYFPLSAIPNPQPPVIRLGVVGSNESAGQDAVLTTMPRGNQPILVMLFQESVLEVPTLSTWGLILMSALLAAAAARRLRRRPLVAGLVLLLSLAGLGVAGAGVIDGLITEWTAADKKADDPAGDPLGADIVAFFAKVDGTRLCLRIDANLAFNQSPVANDDVATIAEDAAATAIDVLANDADPDANEAFTIASVTQPANGTVVITGGGTGLTYQPNANYCNTPPGTAPDTFTYTLTPGGDTATVAVSVTCVDDAPLAVDDAATVAEDAPAAAIDVLANDTDPDAGPKSIASVTQPANGAVVITGGGTGLTYQPNAGYCNSVSGPADTFTYTLAPGGATATVTVTVTCIDNAPVAVDDAATVDEDSGANAIDVLANDTDTDGGPKSVASVTQPANGAVVITGGGTGLTYQPNADYCNSVSGPADTFTYTLAPGGDSGLVTVTVTCIDDAPVAVDDAATVAEDAAATPIDVLANDTDVDGGAFSVTSVTQPANGTVVITGGGTGLTYQPNANYCNTPPGTTLDTFTYTLTPGGDSATVTVTVNCDDDPPTAVDDAATVAEDSGANAIDVLANDTDPDGGPKSVASVTQPANGTVVITGGGTGLTYQPNANYCNSVSGPADTFTYTLAPGGSSATVSVTVTCVDDNPVAVADSATVNEDSGANAIDVLANDTDVDAGPKSVTSVTQPANGAVVITGGGTGLTYQPNANYCNSVSGPADTFTYTLAPGGSSTTVSVTVTCVDDDPVAVADAATVAEDSGANAIDVLANDTDVDAGPKSVTSVTQPANGAVVITGGGTGLTYQPNTNYCNSVSGPADTFTYTLTPGGSIATVSVTVTCVDDNPVAVADAATVNEDSGANAIDVLANDTDVDAGPKSVSSVTQPANGTVVITGGGTGLTYQPNANYCNSVSGVPDTFNYTLAPGGSSTSVTVTVTCVDDPPVAVADAATVDEDSGANAIDVLANDTDVDGGPKSVASVTQPANGAVVITGGGTGLTYQPNPNYCNLPPGTTPDTFTYTLAPGGSSTTVSVLVNCINDAPILTDPTPNYSAVGNTQLRAGASPPALAAVAFTTDGAEVRANGKAGPVTDVDGPGPIQVVAASGPTANGGTFAVETDGDFTYHPPAGFTGTDTFAIQITDNALPVPGLATATVTVAVADMVWYVKNDTATAGNAGTSVDPADTLAEAEAASGANHYIYVFEGDGTNAGQNAGITLKNGQKFLGQGVNLVVGALTLVTGNPANKPLVTDTNDTVTVLANTANGDRTGIQIRGLELSSTGGNAIDVTSANAADLGVEIGENLISGSGPGVEGIDVNVGSTNATQELSLHDNAVTAAGTGIDVARTAGTLTITGFANNSVSGDNGGSGILVTGPASFDAVPGGGLDPIAAGNLAIGASGNTVGGAGLALLTVSGTLNFADIDIFAGGGAGLRLAGTGTANTNLTVGAGVGIVEATGGPAADLSSATVNLQLTSLTSTNSASTGVSLTTVNGTFSAGAGSSITNATGTDFAIDGGTANVTYDGTITDDAGQLVSIANATGGTKSFTGAITDGNDGDGNGISLSSNTGATINFTGGLTLSTGANPAFAATGGGTLHVSGSAVNTIATTTATALNITNTTISASGVTFRSIASNGGGNTGIVLNNTGASGGLTVTGTGGAGTGGTIQNKTVDGVSLINTRSVSLSSMVIDNNDGSGIFGDDVTNFSLIGSSVTNNADSTGGTEAGLRFNELLGTCAITNTTVGGSHEDNVRLTPASGVLSNLAISGSTFGPNPVGTGANGIAIVATGTAALTVSVTASTFDGNQTSGFLTSFSNTATGTINISGSTISDNNIGIDLGTGLSSDQTFNLLNNTLLRHNSNAINIVTAGDNTNASQFRGTISGNQIGDGTADSGSRTSFGIAVDLRGDVDAVIAITNNTVRNTDIEGIFVQSRLDNDADAEVGQLDLTLTGNVARIPDDNSAFPFGAIYGTRVEARNTTVLCLDIAGNDAESVGAFEDIRLRQRDTSTFRLERFVGSGTTDTDVESFLVGQNPLIVDADATHATTFTGVADGFCENP